MPNPSRSLLSRLAASLLVVGLATACNNPPPPALAQAAATSLSGTIGVDGSRTVFPVSKAMADAFHAAHPNVQMNVTATDTAPGLKRLCAGEIEIADASRPMTAAEIADCAAHGVSYLELPVAFDSLTVVVSQTNTFVDCLTVAELKKMWEPAAQGKVTRWSDVRPGFPAQPLALFGPGQGSGTFDYFTLAVVGENSQSRTDYTSTADLGVVADGVAATPTALGFFGYASYQANKDRLKAVPIDNGRGFCVAPSPDTVTDETYEPLSRPIFIYVNAKAAARAEVQAFADFYVDPKSAHVTRDVGYLPLPPATLLSVGRRLDTGMTGSIFGGHGSVLGLTAASFENEDRVRSALVR
jgi:phosphate transport system substrate-binding protein